MQDIDLIYEDNTPSMHRNVTLHWTLFLFCRYMYDRRSSVEVAGWTADQKFGVRFPACSLTVCALSDGKEVKYSTKPLSILLTNCLHIVSKVFRSTANHSTKVVGSIRCGSWRIQKNYCNICNLQISTISQTWSPLIFLPFTRPFLPRNLKADSKLSSGTLLCTEMEIEDTNFWF